MNRWFFIFLLISVSAKSKDLDSLKQLMTFGNQQQAFDASLSLAREFVDIRLYDSAKYYANRALELSKVLDDEKQYIEIQMVLGSILNSKNEPDSALSIYKPLESNVLKSQDSTLIAQFYFLLSAPYERKENIALATKYTLIALSIYERQKNHVELLKLYYNMSILFSRSEDFVKSLEYRRKAWKLSSSSSNQLKSKLASALAGCFGELYLKENDDQLLDSSIYYAQIGMKLAKEEGLKSLELSNLGKLIGAYLVKEDFEKGLEACYVMIRDAKIINHDRWLCQGYYKSVDFLIAMKQPQKAAFYADSALRIADQMQWDFYQVMALEMVYKSNKILKNYALSLAALERLKNLNDSLTSVQKTEVLNDLEIKYETEKKELEIANLTQEAEISDIRNRQQLILFGGGVLILILLFTTIFFFLKQRLERQREQTAVHKQQLLRSQMNPHFIFNALTSIRGFLFEKHDIMEGVSYLGKFAKLMRLVLDHSSKEWVTLEEEIDALKVYLEIQQLRFNKGFAYSINIDPEIQLDQIRVPPLLAQPFVENAIEHGFKNIDYEGKVDFTCKSDGQLIRFAIMDNGIGIDHVKNVKKHKSHALRIFQERIHLISRRLKIDLSYVVRDLKSSTGNSGTLIEYSLPIQMSDV